MGSADVSKEDVEASAQALGIALQPGHAEIIAAMLSEIRRSLDAKASALPQDAPLAVFFDAR